MTNYNPHYTPCTATSEWFIGALPVYISFPVQLSLRNYCFANCLGTPQRLEMHEIGKTHDRKLYN